MTALDSTSIVLDTGDTGPATLGLTSVPRMERYAGTRRGGLGLVLGAGVGLAVGMVIGAVRDTRYRGVDLLLTSDYNWSAGLEGLREGDPDGGDVEMAVLIGVLAGGVIGFAIGQSTRSDHWQPVLSDRFGLGLEATPGGARASMSWNMNGD